MFKGENSIKMTIELLIQNGLYSQIGWHEYCSTTENSQHQKRHQVVSAWFGKCNEKKVFLLFEVYI